MNISSLGNTMIAIMLVITLITTFTNVLMIFPTYLAIIYESYIFAMDASNINYVSQGMITACRERLTKIPIFRDNYSKLKVSGYNGTPKQRGETFDVSIEFEFPFTISLAGKSKTFYVPLRAKKAATGLHYYKR